MSSSFLYPKVALNVLCPTSTHVTKISAFGGVGSGFGGGVHFVSKSWVADARAGFDGTFSSVQVMSVAPGLLVVVNDAGSQPGWNVVGCLPSNPPLTLFAGPGGRSTAKAFGLL